MTTAKSNEIRDKIEELIGQHPALYKLLHYFELELQKDRESRWISVKERLPEVGTHILVATEYYDRNKSRLTEIFVGHMNDEGELVNFPDDWTGGDDFEECVSHWQPLPEPPKL